MAKTHLAVAVSVYIIPENAIVLLGEIHFDKEHMHAIVRYEFTCGGLCGNGATAILEKKNGPGD